MMTVRTHSDNRNLVLLTRSLEASNMCLHHTWYMTQKAVSFWLKDRNRVCWFYTTVNLPRIATDKKL